MYQYKLFQGELYHFVVYQYKLFQGELYHCVVYQYKLFQGVLYHCEVESGNPDEVLEHVYRKHLDAVLDTDTVSGFVSIKRKIFL